MRYLFSCREVWKGPANLSRSNLSTASYSCDRIARAEPFATEDHRQRLGIRFETGISHPNQAYSGVRRCRLQVLASKVAAVSDYLRPLVQWSYPLERLFSGFAQPALP